MRLQSSTLYDIAQVSVHKASRISIGVTRLLIPIRLKAHKVASPLAFAFDIVRDIVLVLFWL
jgi:hypothetical protein